LAIYLSTIVEKFTRKSNIKSSSTGSKNHQFYASFAYSMITSEIIMPKTLKTQKKKNKYRNPTKGIESPCISNNVFVYFFFEPNKGN